MELDDGLGDGLGDDEPQPPLLPPDDRLWRHPSEIASHGLPGRRSFGAAPSPAPRVRRQWGAFLSGATGALLVIGMVTAVGGFRTRSVPVRSVERVAVSEFEASAPARLTDATASIVDRVHPAMVQVRAERPDGVLNCSGFIFRADGYILTSQKVLEGARRVIVTLADASRHEAEVVGTDPETAIGVLKIDAGTRTSAPLGTATSLKPGQTAIALGMPTWVAVGVVSAVGRTVQSKDSPLLVDMIQVYAGFDPLASGGPLLDGRGAVIGVTDVLNGQGYATPIDTAREVADQLIRTGHVAYAWLGVDGEDLDSELTKQLGVDGAALVTKVDDDSPAYIGGVHPGDVITDIEDVHIMSMAGLKLDLRSRRPGQAVTLKLIRGGTPMELNVTLIERSARF
jgi:S1-C subfamily serine protease